MEKLNGLFGQPNITNSLSWRNVSFTTLPVVLARVSSVENRIVNKLNLMHYAGFVGATQEILAETMIC